MEGMVHLYARKGGHIFVCWVEPESCLTEADTFASWAKPDYLAIDACHPHESVGLSRFYYKRELPPFPYGGPSRY